MLRLLTLHIVVLSIILVVLRVMNPTVHFAIAERLTPSDNMEALKLTGIISLGCFVAMLCFYGELVFLMKSRT